jgi:hypothetical protein
MLLPLWVAMRSALMPPQAARTEGPPRTRPRRSITPREAHHSARPLYSPVGAMSGRGLAGCWTAIGHKSRMRRARGAGGPVTHPPRLEGAAGGLAAGIRALGGPTDGRVDPSVRWLRLAAAGAGGSP